MVGNLIGFAFLVAVLVASGCNYTEYSVGYHDTHTNVHVQSGHRAPPPVYESHHHHYGGSHLHPYYQH